MIVSCASGDYATGGGFKTDSAALIITESRASPGTCQNPDSWVVSATNDDPVSSHNLGVQVVCQTPITVAGLGVPQFGSLYVAIALGALVYLLLSRRFTRSNHIASSIGDR